MKTSSVIHVILATILTASLFTACAAASSGSSAADSASGTGGAPSAPAASAPEADKSQETVTLKFWHAWSGDEAKKFQSVISRFSDENAGIQVEVLEGTTEEKQLIAMSSGYTFDVNLYDGSTCAKWASTGALEPLDEYISSSGLDRSNFVQSALEMGAYDGKSYGIPYTMDAIMMFYNKDLLAEAGYTEPPKTISEFQKVCQELTQTDADGNYTRVGFFPDQPFIDAVKWPYVFGASIYDPETNRITADSREMIESMEFKLSFYSGYYDNEKAKRFKSGFGQYMSADNPFFQGKTVFSFEGEWFPTFIKDYAPEMNYGVAPAPYPDGRPELEYAGKVHAGMLYIPANAKHKNEAFTFIQWLLSDGPQVELCAAKGNLPVTYSSLNSPELLQKASELEPFMDLVNKKLVRTLPSLPYIGEYQAELFSAEELVYSLDKTPEEALRAVTEKIQPLADKAAQ